MMIICCTICISTKCDSDLTAILQIMRFHSMREPSAITRIFYDRALMYISAFIKTPPHCPPVTEFAMTVTHNANTYTRGSQSLHSKVRIGIIINVKRSEIIVITKRVFINMLITLYNNSTWYMLNYNIYDVIRCTCVRKLTIVLYK